jgi:hypothetical protein
MILAAAVEAAEGAYAFVACSDPAQVEEPLNILRRAGWQALAVAPHTALLQAWMDLDTPAALPAPATGSLHQVPAAAHRPATRDAGPRGPAPAYPGVRP